MDEPLLPMKGLRALEPTESQLEMAVCHFFASKNLMFWKQPSSGYYDAKLKRFRSHVNPYVGKGVPDIVIIHSGRFIGVEMKRLKGTQTEDQKRFEERSRKAGALYYICRSVEDAESIFKAILLLP